MKYADGLVLLTKEERVLQGKIDRLFEVGRCYKMKINVEKTTVKNLTATISNINYDRSKITAECGIFQQFN
jgi:hypothetical protein